MEEKEFSIKPFNHEEDDLYFACGLNREEMQPIEDVFLEKLGDSKDELKTSVIVEIIGTLEVPSRAKVFIAMKAQRVLAKALDELTRDSIKSMVRNLLGKGDQDD